MGIIIIFVIILIVWYLEYHKKKNIHDSIIYPSYPYSNESYKDLLHTTEWNNFRLQILNEHNHTCDWCGTHSNLQVHHKVYFSHKRSGNKFYPWEYKSKHMMVLCDQCHKKYHQKYNVPIYYI